MAAAAAVIKWINGKSYSNNAVSVNVIEKQRHILILIYHAMYVLYDVIDRSCFGYIVLWIAYGTGCMWMSMPTITVSVV